MRFDQYEIWVLNGDHWEMISWFRDLEVANAVARGRSRRVRLIHAVYEDRTRVQEEVIAEVGATREEP